MFHMFSLRCVTLNVHSGLNLQKDLDTCAGACAAAAGLRLSYLATMFYDGSQGKYGVSERKKTGGSRQQSQPWWAGRLTS